MSASIVDQPTPSSARRAQLSKRPSLDNFQDGFREYQEARCSIWDRLAGRSYSMGRYYHRRLENCYRHLVPKKSSVLEIGCGRGDLLAALDPKEGVGIDFSSRMIETAREAHPGLTFIAADAHEFSLQHAPFDYVIFSEIVNDVWDVQTVLERVRPCCSDETRLIFNYFSHVWSVPLRLARSLGLATPALPQNWLTPHDMQNLLEISGYQPLRAWQEVVLPLPIPLLADFANRYLAKILPFRVFALANFLVARPLRVAPGSDIHIANSAEGSSAPKPTVSVVVPARNESGHIDELMNRIPEMGGGTEIIFVEGNSTDDTYERIKEAIAHNPSRNCKLLRQPGKGKGDAVRTGFDAASGDILMILDADITVPPEDLPRFAELLSNGTAEFVNGVRLVYPMDASAMRFLNLVGNKAFSWAFSWLLGQPIRDTLCGTKVIWRRDYDRVARNRAYFGDFDPFGDFDLLFGAARLNLKIVEVPVRYGARRYGETNIQRWRHGVLLLRMVMFAARRLKFV